MFIRCNFNPKNKLNLNGLYRNNLINAIQIINREYGDHLSGQEVNVKFSNGRQMTLSTGKLARFANGTACAQMNDTSVMVTAVSKQTKTQSSFLPLVVDYRQKSAAAGRIPTNFLRRELGPSEKEILSARLIDRSVRPLFSSDYKYETQIVCNMLAVDSLHLPDVLAINAASTALSLSDIPWNGPIGAVRLGFCDNEIVVNPTRRELQSSKLDLVVSATKQNLVVMLEGKSDIILLPDLLKAIKCGTREAQYIVEGIEKLQKMCGRTKRSLEKVVEPPVEIADAVNTMCEMRLREVFRDVSHNKMSRDHAVSDIRSDVVDRVWSSYPDTEPIVIQELFNQNVRHIFRELIFENDVRCDGRSLDDLRKITTEVNMHRPLHGSALFQRGQTQVFSTVALDSQDSALKLDTLSSMDSGVKTKNFFLHYEFPPYATGETGKIGPIGRREIGHGALAEKGLVPIIPPNYQFTIRLTSEVLESNGSSSMASVCCGSMALMDAGVPVQSAAAGVAIGLVTKYEKNDTKHIRDYRILTDILGIEDYMGDMDMKVAGTKKGITALQADIKISGLPLKIIMESLQKANDARIKIIDIMNRSIQEPRKIPKDCWPVTEQLSIEPAQRIRLIGPGGIHIKKIYLETGAQLAQDDDTSYSLFAPSQASLDEAKEMINNFMKTERVPDLDFGGIYTAKIMEIRDIGVMVTLYPTMPPTLLHNSQLDKTKISHPSVLGLEVGQEIRVKYFGRDPVSGTMRLSRKILQGAASSIIKNFNKDVDKS